MKIFSVVIVSLLATQLSMCSGDSATAKSVTKSSSLNLETTLPKPGSGLAVATFAGGCFWCMQPPFDKRKGVISTTVGYTGGEIKHPTYKQVAYGKTKHAEAIQVIYNPKLVTYKQLLHIFWSNIDPTAKDRQFFDVGRHYRTSIFYHSKSQQKLALQSKIALEKSGRFQKPIVTELVKAGPFYRAETYHQKYYKKNPAHYYRYRIGSGRDRFIKAHWGKK